MIASVISYAARLSLAPARLASHIAGSIVRELRGDRSPRAKPANRTGANAQPRRATTAARAKAQPRRATTQARAKAQPKRETTQARAKARPKRATTAAPAAMPPRPAPRDQPLDDVTIARKVESTIFRGVDVDKGKINVNVAERVLWLRGEVRTPDLIKELEARAARMTEIRRVENLLHLPETAASGPTTA